MGCLGRRASSSWRFELHRDRFNQDLSPGPSRAGWAASCREMEKSFVLVNALPAERIPRIARSSRVSGKHLFASPTHASAEVLLSRMYQVPALVRQNGLHRILEVSLRHSTGTDEGITAAIETARSAEEAIAANSRSKAAYLSSIAMHLLRLQQRQREGAPATAPALVGRDSQMAAAHSAPPAPASQHPTEALHMLPPTRRAALPMEEAVPPLGKVLQTEAPAARAFDSTPPAIAEHIAVCPMCGLGVSESQRAITNEGDLFHSSCVRLAVVLAPRPSQVPRHASMQTSSCCADRGWSHSRRRDSRTREVSTQGPRAPGSGECPTPGSPASRR